MGTSFVLRLGALRARTRLGHEPAERAWPQEVLIDVEVALGAAPRACRTDRLQDTLCGDQLAAALVRLCEAGEHQLVEHLAQRLHEAVRRLAPGAAVTLGLTKVAPPIAGLEGGMSVVIAGRSAPRGGGSRSAPSLRRVRRRQPHQLLPPRRF